MSGASAIDRIVREHKRRHANNTDQPRCPYCRNFVRLEPYGPQTMKGVCKNCGKAILQYRD